MLVFMLILLAVMISLLILVGSFVPIHSSRSAFEVKRLLKKNDERVIAEQARESLLDDVISLQTIVASLLLVSITAIAVISFGWVVGLLVAIVIACLYGGAGRLGVVRAVSEKIYASHEQRSLRFVKKFAPVFRYVRHISHTDKRDTTVDSRDELLHIISNSGALLSAKEKKLIDHSLSFTNRLVSDIMTPRKKVVTIAKNELLGPLVLHDLHTTGHQQFPVVDKDLDHILGILFVNDFLTLDIKRSVTAEKAMKGRAYYINERQTLPQALAVCLSTHSHILIVVNDAQVTVGLLSLSDIFSSLTGGNVEIPSINHDDIRAVSAYTTNR